MYGHEIIATMRLISCLLKWNINRSTSSSKKGRRRSSKYLNEMWRVLTKWIFLYSSRLFISNEIGKESQIPGRLAAFW